MVHPEDQAREKIDHMLTKSGWVVRDVVDKDQIRAVVRTYRDKLFTEIFPGYTEVPKTIIFARDEKMHPNSLKIVLFR